MVVSPHTDLIPYDQRHYAVQPFIAENALVARDVGGDSIEHQNRFQLPHAPKMIETTHAGVGVNRYDSDPFLYVSNDHPVGLLVDLYA